MGNFAKVINQSNLYCKNCNISVSERFADVGKTLKIPNNTEKIIDNYKLTRYACYLIAQNEDNQKTLIVLAQTYFAIQTRKKLNLDYNSQFKNKKLK